MQINGLLWPNTTHFWGSNLISGIIYKFKRVGLAFRIQVQIQSGRVEFKKGSNSVSIYILLNKAYLNQTRPVFGLGLALRFEFGRIGPQGQNLGRVGRLHLVALLFAQLDPKLGLFWFVD